LLTVAEGSIKDSYVAHGYSQADTPVTHARGF
jgi:hypothetical protein